MLASLLKIATQTKWPTSFTVQNLWTRRWYNSKRSCWVNQQPSVHSLLIQLLKEYSSPLLFTKVSYQPNLHTGQIVSWYRSVLSSKTSMNGHCTSRWLTTPHVNGGIATSSFVWFLSKTLTSTRIGVTTDYSNSSLQATVYCVGPRKVCTTLISTSSKTSWVSIP